MRTLYLCASTEKQKEFTSFLDELRENYVLKDINDYEVDHNSLILVLGGDGSLNYLVNEVNNLNNQRIIYFPCGTANDFAKSLRIVPVVPTVEVVRDIIDNAPLLDIPIMFCNERRFINVATAGALALITESGSDLLKQLTGKLSYFVGALEEIISPGEYRISYKLENTNERSILTNGFIVSQGLFAGGGAKVSPLVTSSFKEKFHFLTLESEELGSCLGDIVKMQQRDTRLNLKDSNLISEQLESLTIESSEKIPVKLDGEEYSSKTLYFLKDESVLKFYQY